MTKGTLLEKLNYYEEIAINGSFADDWREDVYVELIKYLQGCKDNMKMPSMSGLTTAIDELAQKVSF